MTMEVPAPAAFGEPDAPAFGPICPVGTLLTGDASCALPDEGDGGARAAVEDAQRFVKGRLKMRQLLLLIALDDHKNIHRAAEELCVTQPAASKQLLELEATLGVRLFDRLPRGMAPTVFGDTMIRYARIALNSLAMAHGDVMAMRSGIVGRIEIGAISTSAMSVLPRAIAQVKKASPTLQIGIQVDASHVLIERLRLGTLDFMIGRLGENAEGLVYEEFSDEAVCAVAKTAHPLLGRPDIGLAELANAPWILPQKDSILRSRFDWMFRRQGVAPPTDVVESSSVPLILALLRETEALHLMPVEMASYFSALGVLGMLPVRLDCHMDAFGLIRDASRVISPGAGLLLGALRTLARESGWMSGPLPATA
jgi:DNA-binding transcriptional LysR family regulator